MPTLVIREIETPLPTLQMANTEKTGTTSVSQDVHESHTFLVEVEVHTVILEELFDSNHRNGIDAYSTSQPF